MVKILCLLSSKYIKKRMWWPYKRVSSLFKLVFQNQTIVIHRSESIWSRGKGGVSHRKKESAKWPNVSFSCRWRDCILFGAVFTTSHRAHHRLAPPLHLHQSRLHPSERGVKVILRHQKRLTRSQDNKKQRTCSKRGFSKDNLIQKTLLTRSNNFKRDFQQRVTCSLMLINIILLTSSHRPGAKLGNKIGYSLRGECFCQSSCSNNTTSYKQAKALTKHFY